MRYFLNLKSKIKQKNLHPSLQICYCLLTPQDSPCLQFPPTLPASLALSVPFASWASDLCPQPSHDLTRESGNHSSPPSSLPPENLTPTPAHLHSCWHGLSWILPGLFQWFLNWFPHLQPLLGSIKPIPATVIFPESSAQATSLLKHLQELPLVDKEESTLFEQALHG